MVYSWRFYEFPKEVEKDRSQSVRIIGSLSRIVEGIMKMIYIVSSFTSSLSHAIPEELGLFSGDIGNTPCIEHLLDSFTVVLVMRGQIPILMRSS